MKKIFLITTVLIFSIGMLKSQSQAGVKQLNAGVGFSGWGIPIYVGMDFGVHPDITVGFEGSFRSYREKYINVYYDHTILGFSGNGNYHFNTLFQTPKEWDFYAGLSLGFYVWDSPNDYHGDGFSGLGLGAQLGIRYFLSQKFGLNLEFGGGNVLSGGKFGITYRF